MKGDEVMVNYAKKCYPKDNDSEEEDEKIK